MRSRFFVFIGMLVALASCVSYSADYSVFEAAQQQRQYSEPIGFLPEAEPTYFRKDLLRVSQMQFTNEYTSEMRSVEESYEILGCNIGNNLAIDANGNIYLNPFNFFKVDLNEDFEIKMGREAVVRKGSVFYSKTKHGESIYKESLQTKEGALLVYSALSKGRIGKVAQDGRSAAASSFYGKQTAKLSDNDLTITGGLGLQRRFEIDSSGIINFNNGSKRIIVEQIGDSYEITISGITPLISYGTKYTVYFLENRLVFTKGKTVLLDMSTQEDKIIDRKTGKLIAEYKK